jgi:hypothetical protein
MVKRKAYCEINIAAQIARIALRVHHIPEAAAEHMRDEIRRSLPESQLPAPPGQPPHSTGPYRDAWRSTKTKRKGLRLVAYTFNLATTKSGLSLGDILEIGEGPVHPHPHYRPVIPRGREKAQELARRAYQ